MINNGVFSDQEIFSIIRANEDDPTTPGQYGTFNMRHSKDMPNVDLSFSLILVHKKKFGYITFDLECNSLQE